MIEVSATFIFVIGMIVGFVLGAACIVIAALQYKSKEEKNGRSDKNKKERV